MTPESFISRWSAASASERSNSQLFLSELADLLNVERPHNNFDHGYAFEFTVTEHQHNGGTSERRIDLNKRACFVLESKQFQTAAPDPTALAQAAIAAAQPQLKKKSAPFRGTDQWDDAMTRARGGRTLHPRSPRLRTQSSLPHRRRCRRHHRALRRFHSSW